MSGLSRTILTATRAKAERIRAANALGRSIAMKRAWRVRRMASDASQLTRASAVQILNEILDPYEAMLLAKGDPRMTYLNNIRFLRPLLGHTPIALIDTKLLNAFAKARGLRNSDHSALLRRHAQRSDAVRRPRRLADVG